MFTPFPNFFLINSLYYLFFIMKLIKVNFAKMYIIWIWFCFYSYLSFEYIKKINCDTFLIKFALHHTICNSSMCMTVSHLRDLTYYMFKNIFFYLCLNLITKDENMCIYCIKYILFPNIFKMRFFILLLTVLRSH